jgi:hypothetical protein
MYYYFISSLPEIRFGEVPLLSLADFDRAAENEMTPDEWRQMVNFTNPAHPEDLPDRELSEILRTFFAFEKVLRSRIAAKRAEKLGRTQELFPVEMNSDIEAAVNLAASAKDATEREAVIDNLRIRFLDECGENHYFDFEALCIYRIKLAIAEKQIIRSNIEKGRENFNRELNSLFDSFEFAATES